MGQAQAIAEGRASGPDAGEPGLAIGYPRLLGLLEDLELRGTFFIEGWNALHHPDRVEALAERGHEVALHGWMHERFASLDEAGARRVLEKGTSALERLGIRPRGFRAPGGVRGRHTTAILRSLGFRYDSSTDADDRLTQPGLLAPGLAHIPWREEMVDSIQYLRHPVRPRTPQEMEGLWQEGIQAAAQQAQLVTLVIHAHVSGVDAERFAVVRRVLEQARRRGDLEITTAGTIAERVLSA